MSLLSDPLFHKAAALKSRVYFHHYYVDQANVPPPHQKTIFSHMDANTRSLILAPRTHIKSTTVAFSFPIQEICKDQNVRVLIVQKTQTAADKTVGQIRAELEKNERLKADFNVQIEKFGSSAFTVKRTKNLKDPTVEGVGVLGAITGGHFDYVIFDDIIDDENVKTAGRREDLKNWFLGTINLVKEPHTKFFGIGTRKSHNDLYSELKRNDMWAVLELKAVKKWPSRYEYERNEAGLITGIREVSADAEVLWPEKWPITALLLEKANIGSVLFNREMQNEPITDEDSPLKYAWLKFYAAPPEKVKYRVSACDLAISLGTKADYFVLATVAVTTDNVMYLEGYIRGRFTFPEQVQIIKNHAAAGNISRIGVEAVMYQTSLIQQLQAETTLPVFPIKQSKAKETRIASLGPFFESGKLLVKEGMAELVDEYVTFPRGEHDDILDAVEMAVRMATEGSNGTTDFYLI